MKTFLTSPALTQEDGYTHDRSGSLQYLLCLNGIFMGCNHFETDLRRSHTVEDGLRRVAPELMPGEFGPISIVMIL